MRVSCPSCNAESSLEVLLGREADVRALAAFIERHVSFGEQLVRYAALFRPAKRRLGIARLVQLLGEVLPDIERGAITRKGREWAAPREAWKAGIDAIFAKRDKGTLTLPLTNHGLLLEIICSGAEQLEARAEVQREEDRRNRRASGARDPGPRNLADIAETLADSAGSAPRVVIPTYTGPSKAALALQAQIAATRQRGAASDPAQTAQEPQS